jgi:hypothetical protein
MFKNPSKYINKSIGFGIIDDVEFKNKEVLEKMRDLPNLNREHDEKIRAEREQEEKTESKKEEKEVLQSNSRLDNYYKKLNNLKALQFGLKYKEMAILFLLLYELYLEKSNGKIYDKDGVVLKPAPDITENYIRIRIRDPKTIVDGTFRTIVISESRGIKAVIGRLKKDPKGPTKVQSVLFDKDKWTADKAMAWVREHREDLKNLVSDDFKEKRLDSYVDGGYVDIDKDKGKPEERWVWCNNCENNFDYYRQLLDDKSILICPHCGALVIFEEA